MADTRIEAGELNKQIILERDVAVDADNNSTGEHVPDYQPLLDGEDQPLLFWAGIRQLSGREIEKAALRGFEATHLVTMRYQSLGIKPRTWRAKLGSRIFSFGNVDNVEERNIKLEITACEKQ